MSDHDHTHKTTFSGFGNSNSAYWIRKEQKEAERKAAEKEAVKEN